MKTYKMTINGKNYEAKILEYMNNEVKLKVNGVDFIVELEREKSSSPQLVRSERITPAAMNSIPVKQETTSAGAVLAPIPGTIHSIKVKTGDKVNSGDTVLILEAMKMESEIAATSSGTVKSILVNIGDSVQEGQALLEIGE